MKHDGHKGCCGSHAKTGAAKDPVCGMDVDPATARHKTNYKEETYYFCAENCLKKFEADPEQYLQPQKEKPVIARAIYICPMHP